MASNSEPLKVETLPNKPSRLVESKVENPSAAPFEILIKYSTHLKNFRKRKETERHDQKESNTITHQVLSFESLMKSASASTSCDNVKGMGFALDLLRAAEKFSCHQFEDAIKLLRDCCEDSLSSGTPIERVVHYFAEALGDKIKIETDRMGVEETKALHFENLMKPKPSSLAYGQVLPICHIIQFTGIQVILDNVASSRKIHLVDFAISIGSHWTILMHALADRTNCPLEKLKITAVGTSKDTLEEDIRNEFFKLRSDEVLIVFSKLCLWSLLAWPERLERLIRAIKNLNPFLMVVTEVDANINTSTSLSRFCGLLFLISAMFDCLETSVEQNYPFRRFAEEVSLGGMIRNIVLGEGGERIVGNIKVEFWRELFGRFGIVEVDFSESCFCQASILVKTSGHGSLKMNGKSLVLEWKGTRVLSLSAWKFHETQSSELGAVTN